MSRSRSLAFPAPSKQRRPPPASFCAGASPRISAVTQYRWIRNRSQRSRASLFPLFSACCARLKRAARCRLVRLKDGCVTAIGGSKPGRRPRAVFRAPEDLVLAAGQDVVNREQDLAVLDLLPRVIQAAAHLHVTARAARDDARGGAREVARHGF